MTTLVLSSQTLQTTPGTVGLLQQVNLALQGLLNIEVTGFTFIARDTQRRNGRYLDVVLTYDSPAAAPLTQPFVLQAVQGRTAQEVVTQLGAFQTANPGWWFSPINVIFTDTVGGQVRDPYIGWLVASADPNAGANWALGGSGGGGGGSVTRFEASIVGDGVVDTFAVPHNLGEDWPSSISVWDETTRELVVPYVITSIDPNTISLEFSTPVPNGQAYRVVVLS